MRHTILFSRVILNFILHTSTVTINLYNCQKNYAKFKKIRKNKIENFLFVIFETTSIFFLCILILQRIIVTILFRKKYFSFMEKKNDEN